MSGGYPKVQASGDSRGESGDRRYKLVHDPLLKTVAEQTDDGTIVHLIANDPSLPQLVEQLVEAMRNDSDAAVQLRPDLRAGEVGQFIITTALAMLLGITPNTDEPDSARRYIETFVVPAITRGQAAGGLRCTVRDRRPAEMRARSGVGVPSVAQPPPRAAQRSLLSPDERGGFPSALHPQ